MRTRGGALSVAPAGATRSTGCATGEAGVPPSAAFSDVVIAFIMTPAPAPAGVARPSSRRANLSARRRSSPVDSPAVHHLPGGFAMTRPPFSPAPRTATARRLSNLWMPLRGALLAALIALLAAGQLAAAQAAPASFTRILPETTLLAIYAQPGGGSAQVFEELAAELDLDAARETLRKLGVVLGSAADDA